MVAPRLWACIPRERPEKGDRVMRPFAAGIPTAETLYGRPPDDGKPFAVYGQNWTALGNVPRAMESGRAFFQLDNGFWRPGRGADDGYYRVCYRGLWPIFLKDAPTARIQVGMRPWRKRGKHVLIALPGAHFGEAIGFDMPSWIKTVVGDVRKYTDREIVVRPKPSAHELIRQHVNRPLAADLANCWAMVTHSSNVAVDAVLAGIPVFVAPTSPAAPVGRHDLDIENPIFPDRDEWWNSLMAQQFSTGEMRSGFMREMLRAVTLQVDNKPLEELL